MVSRRRRSRRRGSEAPKSGGMTLSRVALLVFAIVVLIFALTLWLTQQLSYDQIRTQQREAKDVISRSVAFQLSKAIASYAHSLESMARDPALIALLRNENQAAIQQRSLELYKAFPYALALRIFTLTSPRLDTKATPPVSYACLDLVNKAQNGEKNPPVELHVPNTPDQHIDLVRPVYSDERLVGYLQLALDVKLVQIWAHTIVGNNYIEIIQRVDGAKPLMIAQGGDKSYKFGEESFYAVKGTPWSVSVWSKVASPILPVTIQSVFIFLVAVTLVGLVIYFLKRAVSTAIRIDATSITQMTADIMRGRKQHDYHLVMPEFLDAARKIQDLNTASTVERERDDDPHAISIGGNDFGDIDPHYMSSQSLSVEEIDEDDVSPAMRQMVNAATKPPHSKAAAEKATFSARDVQHQTEELPLAPSQSGVSSVRQQAPALPPPEIFKAYDIRGIVGSSLTARHATLIGQAIGSEALQRGLKSLAFARDGRLSGPELGGAFVKGVQSTGVDVIDIGMVPTPVLYFAAIEKADGSGVMLTGSHNPPDYNGFKMMLGGETLAGDQIQALRERIEKSEFSSGNGKYVSQGVGKAYLDRIVGDVKLKRPMNIVIDCGNGVAGAIAPLLFKSMGCRVTELYCDVDGKFPNHHPDPSKPENMQDLIAMVKSKGADIGLAFDGDGDRLGVIDSEGNMIYPDRLLMLLAMDVLKRNQGAQIIFDIKCSSNLSKVIWERGGEPIMWKTGHSLIKAKMKQSGAALAGEMSGHIFFNERWYGFDDGLYSAARLLEILSPRRESSAEVFATLPDAVNTPEINVKMREGEQHSFIDSLMMQADFGEANITMIDGIRADYADGWGLVRASNTTPVLVLRFEGKDQKAMQRIQQAFKAQMLAVKPDLTLPF